MENFLINVFGFFVGKLNSKFNIKKWIYVYVVKLIKILNL